MTKAEETETYVRMALRVAEENVGNGGGPFGCVIVKDGRIVATGVNRVTHTNDPTAHAEVVAIREACASLKSFQLTGCVVYSSCEPCPMCLGALSWARPAHIYFAASRTEASTAGFDDELIYREISLDLANRTIPTTRLPLKERTRPFLAWKARADRTPY